MNDCSAVTDCPHKGRWPSECDYSIEDFDGYDRKSGQAIRMYLPGLHCPASSMKAINDNWFAERLKEVERRRMRVLPILRDLVPHMFEGYRGKLEDVIEILQGRKE